MMTKDPAEYIPPIQFSFDAIGFSDEYLALDIKPKPRKRGRKAVGPSTCKRDPYGLLAMRLERQYGLHKCYSMSEYIEAAIEAHGAPEVSNIKCFAFCIVVADAAGTRYFQTPKELFSETRDGQEENGLRHICQHIVVENTKFTTGQVGRVFGRHHASVRHAVNSVAAKRLDSPTLEAELDNFENLVLDRWAFSGDGEGVRDKLRLLGVDC